MAVLDFASQNVPVRNFPDLVVNVYARKFPSTLLLGSRMSI